jgi:hypothetical protein
MGVVMNTTKPVVQEVRSYNQGNCRDEQPGLIMHEKQFQHQQGKAQTKQAKRAKTMVVAFVAMVKGPGPDSEGQKDHTSLKSQVMDDIYAK